MAIDGKPVRIQRRHRLSQAIVSINVSLLSTLIYRC